MLQLKMTKIFIFRMIAIFLGFGIALLLSEGVVRALGITTELTYRPNPHYGWSHTANDEFQTETEGREVRVKINSHGLRDSEYSYEKPENVYRILVLGDSFTEALQVPLNLSFTKQLEQLLGKVSNRGRVQIQVINAGASGYGTDNELLFFRHEGHKYDPDLVLLAFYIGNDIRNNWYELENVDVGGFRKPYFVLGTQGLEIRRYPFEPATGQLTKLKLSLNRHVRLYAFLRQLRDRLRYQVTVEKTGMPLDFNIHRTEYPAAWQTAWDTTGALIKRLNNELKGQESELFIALIPTQYQVHPSAWRKNVAMYAEMRDIEWDLDEPNRKIADFLRSEAIHYVDLLPEFRRQAAESQKYLYFPNDGHWGSDGHLLAAQLIADALVDRKLMTSSRPPVRSLW